MYVWSVDYIFPFGSMTNDERKKWEVYKKWSRKRKSIKIGILSFLSITALIIITHMYWTEIPLYHLARAKKMRKNELNVMTACTHTHSLWHVNIMEKK